MFLAATDWVVASTSLLDLSRKSGSLEEVVADPFSVGVGMRFFVVGFIFLFSASQVLATASAIFGNGYVKIIVQGSQADGDVNRLFHLLNVSPIDNGSSVKKEVSYQGSDGVVAFAIACNIPKRIPDRGTCVATLNQARSVDLRPAEKYVSFQVTEAEEAALVAQLFIVPEEDRSELWISNDYRMRLYYDAIGGRFEFVHRESGL